jgi:oxalate decarboxylase/phosphoglucose isomerase-like protein (cupin superfamily)
VIVSNVARDTDRYHTKFYFVARSILSSDSLGYTQISSVDGVRAKINGSIFMNEQNPVDVYQLDELWEQSTGDPLTLFSGDDPPVDSGTYVIQPGERVPETGTTSHGGPEISVILEGEAVLGLPGAGSEREMSIGPMTITVIPAGVEHYSENPGDEPVKLAYTIAGDL